MPGKTLKEFIKGLRDRLTTPIQPRGQIGNRNAEKQDRPLPGGRDKDIRVQSRRRRRSS